MPNREGVAEMKVAAVQMVARLADVEANLKRAEELLDKAFAMGCEMVILPEFFTSAVAFHPDMLNAALSFDGPALEMMRETPARMARMLGVPVVHAAHAQDLECRMPLLPRLPYRSYYLYKRTHGVSPGHGTFQ